MKRLISMMLAVMLIATLGVLPVCAAEHTDHFIKFLDSNGEESSTIILPPATVGREYSYTIGTSSCGDFPISFELDSGDLPDGLTLNTDGTISGTPTTPTEDAIELLINANGSCPEDDSGYEIGVEANFYLTVQPAPEMITWRIPYTKRVVRGGRKNPGPQTFTLEIYAIGNSSATAPIEILDGTDTIHTDGTQSEYSGVLKVRSTQYTLSEGFKVREKNEGAERWTYSDAFYTIKPMTNPVDFSRAVIYDGEYDFDVDEQPIDRMVFENTYTYSPSHNYDDDDDDDYEPPVRETEEDKEPQPQKDELKSNPSTGRGSTWDYLVYLFHKYFSWAA